MYKQIPINECKSRNFIRLIDLSYAKDYENTTFCLYYAKAAYSSYDGKLGVTLYGFEIVKETACYYTLNTGQRVHKDMKGRIYSTNPAEAVEKAMLRARKYLNILVTRGREVHEFLSNAGNIAKHAVHDLKDFENFAKIADDIDNISPEHYKENRRKDSLESLTGEGTW